MEQPLPLLHFSAGPLKAVSSVRQDAPNRFKPKGLWVSVGHGEDSWVDWCRRERFGLERFVHATEVVLRPDSNVLRVTCEAEIDAFGAEFGRQVRYTARHCTKICWDTVADRYQGVVIAPYLWERRLSAKTHWYYPWDCASGCVWDASAVAELRPVHGLDLRLDAEEVA